MTVKRYKKNGTVYAEYDSRIINGVENLTDKEIMEMIDNTPF